MSAQANPFPYSSGLAGLRMSADQYLAIGQTQERYELSAGVVLPISSPTMRHQALLLLILRQLLDYQRQTQAVFFPEIDWRLDAETVYSPDIVCFRPGRAVELGAYLSEVPDLVIEILSPGNKAFDLTEKKDDYERAGVLECWAIDPADARVRCYRRSENLLIEIPVIADSLASVALPGFTLGRKPLAELAAKA